MARIRQSDEPTRKDGYDSMNEYLKPAAAQSDAPSAEEVAKKYWDEMGGKCDHERMCNCAEEELVEVLEAYAALRTAQLEKDFDALKEEIAPLMIEVNGAKKSLPVWAGLLSKELERTKAAETRAETAESALVDAKKLLEKVSSPTGWWDFNNKTCRFCSSREFGSDRLLIHKATCEISKLRALLTVAAEPPKKEKL